MDAQLISSIKELYETYGFTLDNDKEHTDYLIYRLKQGILQGVHIVRLNSAANVQQVKDEYYEIGYSCEVLDYSSIDQAHEKIFNGFFSPVEIKGRNRQKYDKFVDRQNKLLLDVEYSYVDMPFDLANGFGNSCQSPIDCVVDLLSTGGASLIIIEAAAGFGKTCTVFELLRRLVDGGDIKFPLFTELSSNRTANVFKHVLLDIIDREFSGIKSDIVKYEIKNGNIILIIDGFDELLSKGRNLKGGAVSEEFDDVVGMLNTISDVLDKKGKVVLTTRKSSIFDGDDFHDWIEKFGNKFSVYKIELHPPRIEDWLDSEKLKTIGKSNEFYNSLYRISNPVLLSFFRSLSIERIEELLSDKIDSVIDIYLSRLLGRERERQNLKIDIQDQVSIFKSLAISFIEFGMKSDSRAFVSELIVESNRGLLDKTRIKYDEDVKPSVEALADTLAGHALLDRIDSKGNIGFVNDFLYGYFCGMGLLDKDDEWIKNEVCGDKDMVECVVSSFHYMDESRRIKLYENLSNFSDRFDDRLNVVVGLYLTRSLHSDLSQLYLSDLIIFDSKFDEYQIDGCTFDNCEFHNCKFDLMLVSKTVFNNCKGFDILFKDNAGQCKLGKEIWLWNSHFKGLDGEKILAEFRESDHEMSSDSLSLSRTKAVNDFELRVLGKFWPKGKAFAFRQRPKISILKVAHEDVSHMAEALDSLIEKGFVLMLSADIYVLNRERISEIKHILGR